MRFIKLEKKFDKYEIPVKEKNHLRVLRCKFPLTIKAVCEQTELEIVIEQLGNDLIVKNVKKIKKLEVSGLIVYFPLIDSKRLEWGLEKIIELSIQKIYFYYSDHCFYNKKQIKKFQDRFDKLQNLVEEAQKQSGNLTKPLLFNAVPLEKLYNEMQKPLVLGVHGQDVLEASDIKEMSSLLIGPEGDFSKREYDDFSKRNFTLKKLEGESILRTETALIYMASLNKFF